MSKTKLLFRADGNSQTGLGHLYRLFAIVEMMKDEYEFVFLTKETSTIEVIPKNYQYDLIPNSLIAEEELKWIKSKYSPKDWIIIADGYHFDTEYQRNAKFHNYNLLYIDDLVVNEIFADTIVNHNLNAQSEIYKTGLSTNFGLGSDYAILRPSFLAAASAQRKIDKTETTFVCFGGADPNNLTLKALQALLSIEGILKINILVGAAYKHKELDEISRINSKVSVFKNLSEIEIAKLMQSCDMAIVPSSTILYEVCAINMYVISGYFIENQKGIYASALDKGIIYGIGDFNKVTDSDWKKHINNFIAISQKTNQLENQNKLFNQKISKRFQKLIKLLEQDLSFKLRDAVIEDTYTTYNWASNKLVRQYSFNQNEISFEEHTKWFQTKIESPTCLYYIAEFNNNPIGSIRFDIDKDEATISYLIDPEMHGKGFGMNILKSGLKHFVKENIASVKKIVGYVLPENIASSRIFDHFGFKKETEGDNYKYYKVIS